MGEKKRRLPYRQRFLRNNPLCCYCGAVADTVDEMPPRGMFVQRHWPEEMQFPACRKCNNGRRAIDAVVAMCVKGGELREEFLDIHGFLALAREVSRRYPTLTPKAATTDFDQGRVWQAAGYSALSKLKLPNMPAMISSPEASDSVQIFLLRLLQAIYYREQRGILPLDHFAAVAFNTNSAFLRPGSFDEMAKVMIEGLPIARPSNRGKMDLTAQFHYRWGRVAEEEAFCYCAKFGTAFVGFAFSAPESFFYRHNLRPTFNMNGKFLNR